VITIFLPRAASISPLARQAQIEQYCYQRAFQEPYDGNHQRLQLVPHFIQVVERNVLPDGHWLREIGQSELQWFGRSKQPLRQQLYLVLLLQSCWMQWVPHATAWVQGTYVVCSINGIPWCWGTYLLRGPSKQLVVEWTGTLVESHHHYHDFEHLNSYVSRVELRWSLYFAVQTSHIFHTIQATRING